MPECDLSRNRHEAHQSQCQCGFARRKTKLDQIFGLMNLNRVPGEQSTEIAGSEPPKTRCPQGAPQCPVDCRPGMVDDIPSPFHDRTARGHTVRLETEVF